MSQKKSSSVDIFDMLSDSGGKTENKTEPAPNFQRQELLASTKYKDKDLYPEGTIIINKYSCVGLQCKLCIEACPTNALYWTNSGIEVIEDLCLHCAACVLCCMVDDCIKVSRKRPDGKTESFSKPKDVLVLIDNENAKNRSQRICDIYPSAEDYFKKHGLKRV